MLTEVMNITGTKNKREDEILSYICKRLSNAVRLATLGNLSQIEEIRLRAERPLILEGSGNEWFVEKNCRLSQNTRDPLIVTREDINETLMMMSENSIYAYQEEINNGYITLRGGHRVGICGRVNLENKSVKNIKDVSGLNIRIAREVKGCSSKLFKYMISDKGTIYNTLIISPPQCGKTTILRDIARNISNGMHEYGFKGQKVGIVDERSEIAAMYKGVPQYDIGIRTDVLDGCPKSIGMPMMLRSMSPAVVITDEIGNTGDSEIIMQVMNAGVKICTSAHGYNISELKTRREVLKILEEKVFERFVVLNNKKGPGTVHEIIDGTSMEVLYGFDT